MQIRYSKNEARKVCRVTWIILQIYSIEYEICQRSSDFLENFIHLKAYRKLRVRLSDSLCDECQVDGHANEISKLTTSGWPWQSAWLDRLTDRLSKCSPSRQMNSNKSYMTRHAVYVGCVGYYSWKCQRPQKSFELSFVFGDTAPCGVYVIFARAEAIKLRHFVAPNWILL